MERREEKSGHKNDHNSMFRKSLKPIFISLESQGAGDKKEMKRR